MASLLCWLDISGQRKTSKDWCLLASIGLTQGYACVAFVLFLMKEVPRANRDSQTQRLLGRGSKSVEFNGSPICNQTHLNKVTFHVWDRWASSPRVPWSFPRLFLSLPWIGFGHLGLLWGGIPSWWWKGSCRSKAIQCSCLVGTKMGSKISAGKQTSRNDTLLLPCGLFMVEEKYPHEPNDYYRRSECCLAPPPRMNDSCI